MAPAKQAGVLYPLYNALVEGKNAHVVRKWFGHDHIPQYCAGIVNEFALRELSPFLNFHRTCLYATGYCGRVFFTWPRCFPFAAAPIEGQAEKGIAGE